MATTTTALLLNEIKGPFSLSEVNIGPINEDEALVEIHATGICHTDLSCADGSLPAAAPAVFGHEGAGVVKEVGAGIQGIAPGDKVLLSFSACNDCDQCKDGHPAYCYSFVPLNFGGKRTDGSSAVTTAGEKAPVYSSFFGQSSFARHAVVHKSSIVKVPADTKLELCAPLGCGLQTGAGAVLNTLNVQSGKTVAVFGVGSVGMSAVMAAKIRGAKEIIAIDLQQSRLDLAKKLGATQTILGNEEDIVSKIQQMCPPNGVNYAVDGTGVPKVVETMVECLGTRGRAATVGAAAPGAKVGVEVFSHLIGGKEYVGCCEGDAIPKEMIAYLMEQHAKGNYPIEELVTFYPVKDFEQAIKDTKEGKALKAVLRWE